MFRPGPEYALPLLNAHQARVHRGWYERLVDGGLTAERHSERDLAGLDGDRGKALLCHVFSQDLELVRVK